MTCDEEELRSAADKLPSHRKLSRNIDARVADLLNKMISGWYGNYSEAATALGYDRRQVWRWVTAREVIPDKVLRYFVKNRRGISQKRRTALRNMYEKKIAKEMKRVDASDSVGEQLTQLLEVRDAPALATLAHTRLGYRPIPVRDPLPLSQLATPTDPDE